MTKYIIIFRRDLLLVSKQGWAAPLGFFLIIMLAFPLGMAPAQNLSNLSAGLIWIGLLLAHLLILPRMFEADLADGVMDLISLETKLPAAVIIAKSAALWVGASWPLVALTPVAGLMLGMQAEQFGSLIASALMGSLALVLFGSFAAALTAGLRSAPWLAPLIILPLELPVLIFGAQSALAPIRVFFTLPPNLILIGLVLLALALAPAASALALKLNET